MCAPARIRHIGGVHEDGGDGAVPEPQTEPTGGESLLLIDKGSLILLFRDPPTSTQAETKTKADNSPTKPPKEKKKRFLF